MSPPATVPSVKQKGVVSYGVAETDACLRQILDLQARNHYDSIGSAEEIAREGYVTVKHSFDLIKRMNTPHPHVVARAVKAQEDENQSVIIVGYTLVLDPVLGAEIPLLDAMFQRINAIEMSSDNGEKSSRLLRDCRYFVMGQVCIDQEYRGQGVFANLYQELQRRMAAHGYEYIITLVSRHNPRSLRAHLKVGFVTLQDYEQGTEHWELIGLGPL